eukprot:GHVP01032503.1.p1 GENE.GHVP01032503.1~~GHVP01032503.1.p1  ORF type:complete len:215 (-),score=18.50 GHVP01032503.1:2436-3080(-)
METEIATYMEALHQAYIPNINVKRLLGKMVQTRTVGQEHIWQGLFPYASIQYPDSHNYPSQQPHQNQAPPPDRYDTPMPQNNLNEPSPYPNRPHTAQPSQHSIKFQTSYTTQSKTTFLTTSPDSHDQDEYDEPQIYKIQNLQPTPSRTATIFNSTSSTPLPLIQPPAHAFSLSQHNSSDPQPSSPSQHSPTITSSTPFIFFPGRSNHPCNSPHH